MKLLAKNVYYNSLKEQKQEELIKTSKKDIPNVGMVRWRHWPTKYTHRQEEHIP